MLVKKNKVLKQMIASINGLTQLPDASDEKLFFSPFHLIAIIQLHQLMRAAI